MTPYITLILLIVLAVEMILKPRFDRTEEGNLLLWYGKDNRKFIKL